MIEREDAERLRKIGTIGQIDDDESLAALYRVVEHIETALDFNRTDVHAVHHAMLNAREEAKQRAEKMPSSSIAMDRHADDLKAVLDKLLELVPAEVRETYSSYAKKPEPDLSPAEIEDRYGCEADIARQSKMT